MGKLSASGIRRGPLDIGGKKKAVGDQKLMEIEVRQSLLGLQSSPMGKKDSPEDRISGRERF